MWLNENINVEEDGFSLEEVTDKNMWLIQWGSWSHAPTIPSPEDINLSEEVKNII